MVTQYRMRPREVYELPRGERAFMLAALEWVAEVRKPPPGGKKTVKKR